MTESVDPYTYSLVGIVGKNTELKQMKNLELTNSLWNKGRYSWCRNLLQMVLQRLYSHCSRGWEWKPDQGLCSLMKDHLRLHSVIEHETWKNTDDVKHHSFCVGKLQFVNRKWVFTDHLRMNITITLFRHSPHLNKRFWRLKSREETVMVIIYLEKLEAESILLAPEHIVCHTRRSKKDKECNQDGDTVGPSRLSSGRRRFHLHNMMRWTIKNLEKMFWLEERVLSFLKSFSKFTYERNSRKAMLPRSLKCLDTDFITVSI